jgi:hypothetical protein
MRNRSLTDFSIRVDKFAATCVLVDKLEKVPLESLQGDLEVNVDIASKSYAQSFSTRLHTYLYFS